MSLIPSLRQLPRAAPVVLRRTVTEPGTVAVLAVVVLVTTFLAAGLPRWLESRADAALREAVAAAPPQARNLSALRRSVIPPGPAGATMAPVTDFGEGFRADLSGPIRSVIEDHTWMVESAVMALSLTQPALGEGAPDITFPRELHLRHQEGVADHIAIVDGRMPTATSEVVDNPLGEAFFGSSDVHVVEVALSGMALDELEVEVGQRLLLTPMPGRCCPRPVFVDVVGELEVPDPDARYWFDDRVAEPRVTPEGDSKRVTAYGVFGEEAYPGVIEALNEQPLTYTWRYRVDPARIDGGQLDRLSSDLRRLEAEFGQASALSDVTQVQSGLLGIFGSVADQERATQAVLALAAIGVLAIALVVMGLTGGLLAERRRGLVEVLRARGASTAQVLTAHAADAAVVVVPAAIVAGAVAIGLVDGRTAGLSLVLAAVLAVAGLGIPVIAAAPDARRSLLRLRRPEVGRRAVSPRRLVLEGLVVAVTVIGVVLLQRRGVGGEGGLDVYLAAVPVLLGLATGLLVLRLHPIPLRALALGAAGRRDLVPALGLRRAVRQPHVTAAPLLVLVLAVAVAVFASVLLRTVEHRQLTSSWQQVGAEARVDAGGSSALHSGVDVSQLEGVDTVAPAYVAPAIQAAEGGGLVSNVHLLALDGTAYADVVDGMPDAPDLPSGLREAAGPGGTADDPLPTLVSTDWMGGTARPGDRFYVRIGGQQVHFAVHATADAFPTVPSGQRFVVAPLAAVDAATTRPLAPNRLYIDGDISGPRLIEELRAQDAGVAVASRHELLADVRDAPLVAGTVRAFRAAVVLAAAYAALAIGVALTLSARVRARDLAYLRTLGLSERQALGLAAVELAPPMLFATLAGAVLGIATAHIVAPGIDLSAFVGAAVPGGLVVDPVATAGLAGAVLAAVAATALGVTLRTRRTDLSRTLRMGDA